MGKRSGIPHRDDELAAMSLAQIEAELGRCCLRLAVPLGATSQKAFHKRIHWLERAIAARNS